VQENITVTGELFQPLEFGAGKILDVIRGFGFNANFAMNPLCGLGVNTA
jgi:hypothetical protein